MDKVVVMREQEKAVDELEKILDFSLGKNRGAQIPNHPGNGQVKITVDEVVMHANSAIARNE